METTKRMYFCAFCYVLIMGTCFALELPVVGLFLMAVWYPVLHKYVGEWLIDHFVYRKKDESV